MEDWLNDLVEKEDYYYALDCVQDQKEALLKAWQEGPHREFERCIRLAIQDVESVKIQNPRFAISIEYLIGTLDGYTELLEKLFRTENRMHMITETLTRQSPKVRQILLCLYERDDGIKHGELADKIGSSYSSLTNIMKKVLFSGAVEATRSGRNTYYYLTDVGRQYCEQQGNSENELRQIIQTAVKEAVRQAFEGIEAARDSLGQLKVGDTFIPVIDNEIGNPLAFESTVKIGNLKYPNFRTISNVEDRSITATVLNRIKE